MCASVCLCTVHVHARHGQGEACLFLAFGLECAPLILWGAEGRLCVHLCVCAEASLKASIHSICVEAFAKASSLANSTCTSAEACVRTQNMRDDIFGIPLNSSIQFRKTLEVWAHHFNVTPDPLSSLDGPLLEYAGENPWMTLMEVDDNDCVPIWEDISGKLSDERRRFWLGLAFQDAVLENWPPMV